MGKRTWKAVETVWQQAYDAAFPLIAKDIQAALPEGWTVWLAVGWGVTVVNKSRKSVERGDPAYPLRLRAAVEQAERFVELFCANNAKIRNTEIIYTEQP